jgi:hypothetical protein
MEEGEGEGLERFDVLEESDKKKAPIPQGSAITGGAIPTAVPAGDNGTPETEKDEEKSAVTILDEAENRRLKAAWTDMFLNANGFDFILNQFMEKQISASTQDSQRSQFELKHIAFLLKLLRIFIMAAFSAGGESSVYDAASLVRRSSSSHEEGKEEEEPTLEGSRF